MRLVLKVVLSFLVILAGIVCWVIDDNLPTHSWYRILTLTGTSICIGIPLWKYWIEYFDKKLK